MEYKGYTVVMIACYAVRGCRNGAVTSSGNVRPLPDRLPSYAKHRRAVESLVMPNVRKCLLVTPTPNKLWALWVEVKSSGRPDEKVLSFPLASLVLEVHYARYS